MKYNSSLHDFARDTSHPARGAWIEIKIWRYTKCRASSHPARGAWIEIWVLPVIEYKIVVAPRKGCVD